MAAIAYFEKTLEDADRVTYSYGKNEDDLDRSITIRKADQRPADDRLPPGITGELAFGAIVRGYRKQGEWPARGAGYT